MIGCRTLSRKHSFGLQCLHDGRNRVCVWQSLPVVSAHDWPKRGARGNAHPRAGVMSDRFTIMPTRLRGLHVLERHPHRDSRGTLERLFCEQDLQAVFGSGRRVVQINRTLTRLPGTVRGMHFQRPPHAEVKVVTCLRGEVFDVAVDLRPSSPTFLEWHGELLNETNGRSLLIPEGFAHGFQTITVDCELLYFHSAAWCAAAEGGLNPIDPRIAIAWPQPVSEMSDRDRRHPLLDAGHEDVLCSKAAA